MNRRQDVIDAAVALVREGGPSALTTVAVASRLGVTQSAIYRHVHNVAELAALASRVIVADLQAEMHALLDDPDLSWEHDGDTAIFCARIVELMAASPKSFELIDRWQYADGDLGAGIRDLLDQAIDGTVAIVEGGWRKAYGYRGELDASDRAALRVYASLINGDVIDVARLARAGNFPGGPAAIARILELRMIGGQLAFNSDMNRRFGLPPVFN